MVDVSGYGTATVRTYAAHWEQYLDYHHHQVGRTAPTAVQSAAWITLVCLTSQGIEELYLWHSVVAIAFIEMDWVTGTSLALAGYAGFIVSAAYTTSIQRAVLFLNWSEHALSTPLCLALT
jgi:hypothetical protein